MHTDLASPLIEAFLENWIEGIVFLLFADVCDDILDNFTEIRSDVKQKDANKLISTDGNPMEVLSIDSEKLEERESLLDEMDQSKETIESNIEDKVDGHLVDANSEASALESATELHEASNSARPFLEDTKMPLAARRSRRVTSGKPPSTLTDVFFDLGSETSSEVSETDGMGKRKRRHTKQSHWSKEIEEISENPRLYNTQRQKVRKFDHGSDGDHDSTERLNPCSSHLQDDFNPKSVRYSDKRAAMR